MAGASSDQTFEVRTNLRPLLEDLKQINPKLATGTRRALREAGDSIIARQRAILASVPVGGVVSKTTYTKSMANRRGGVRSGANKNKLAGARIISIESQASARGYHTGLREQAAANLTTRVTTPRSGRGASVRVASAKPSWINKALNSKKWRHPTFGHAPYVEQAGNQYFSTGVKSGIVEAREAIMQVVEDAAKLIKSHPLE